MKSGKQKDPSQPGRAPTRSVARKINGKLQITAFNATRHLRPTCGAQAKSTGELCRDIAMANGRCYRHGGRTPKGKNWHLPVWPDGKAPGAMDKVDRKLRDLQRAAKRREKRVAAMNDEERSAYDRWKRSHQPVSAADRVRARAERKQNAETRAFLAQDAVASLRASPARHSASRLRNALGLGQDVFDRSVRPDELRQRLAGMTDDEREAFTIGARDQLAEVMGTARRDATAARGMFEQGWNREKLGLVLGDDERAGAFLETLGRETDFANRANGITGNSASARRLERAGEYTGRTGAVRGALDPASGLWGDTKRAGAKIIDTFIDGRAARSAEEMRGEFGDAVSRQGRERDELLEAIMGYGTRKAAGAAKTARDEVITRAILAGGAMAAIGAYAR